MSYYDNMIIVLKLNFTLYHVLNRFNFHVNWNWKKIDIRKFEDDFSYHQKIWIEQTYLQALGCMRAKNPGHSCGPRTKQPELWDHSVLQCLTAVPRRFHLCQDLQSEIWYRSFDMNYTMCLRTTGHQFIFLCFINSLHIILANPET